MHKIKKYLLNYISGLNPDITLSFSALYFLLIHCYVDNGPGGLG